MSSMQWVTKKFHVKNGQFSRCAFRNAFKATVTTDGSKWVTKKYIPKAVKNMVDLCMTLEDHVREQVQLHSAARNIDPRCAGVL